MYLNDLLQMPTERIYTDEGFLEVPARISRTGIQNYKAVEMGVTDKDPEEIIRVFRPEEEVFSDNSLQSFANKPVTDDHPPELVNAKNAKTYAVGHAGQTITRDGDFVKTILHVTDADAITKIESGKVELSNGYLSDIDWTPGVTPDGEEYDAIQRNIRGNHIAIVERGRAGSDCRVADNLTTEKGDEVIMAKVTIDGVDFEVPEQAAQAIGKLQIRLSDAEETAKSEAEKTKAKEDELEEEKKNSKAKEDEMKAKVDEAEEKVPTADALDKMVADRAELVSKAQAIHPYLDWKGKDAATIKAEVVAHKCPKVQMDSVSAEYIDARFDMLVEDITTNSQSNLDEMFSNNASHQDSDKSTDTRPLSVVARDKMAEQSREAWKGGTK